MSEIRQIRVADIEPNPMRQLREYPYNEEKIATLRRSIREVGLWESVIARPVVNGTSHVQLAFGHHRVEAAKREFGGDATVPVIIRDLTDEEMLKLLGRENLEDYNADFLVMMEAWEATETFVYTRAPDKKPQALDIARVLGWTRDLSSGHAAPTQTAEACSGASRLIHDGHLKREELAGLSVFNVREIVQSVIAQQKEIERLAKENQSPASEVTRAKHHAGRAGAAVAKQVREGKVSRKDIRTKVDVYAYRSSRASKRQTPLFDVFGRALGEQIYRVCNGDAIESKLKEIKAAFHSVEMQEDVAMIRRIGMECRSASDRFNRWAVTMANPPLKNLRPKPKALTHQRTEAR